MARIGQGPGFKAIPVLTKGLSDQVWVSSGEARSVDGCYFQVVGTVEKAKGVRNLVDWHWQNHHLLNTRINGVSSFRPRGGPDELVVSLSGDSGEAAPFYPDLSASPLKEAGETKDKYRAGRVLVVRGDSLENIRLPHLAEGSPWDDNFSNGEEGDRFIAGRRVHPSKASGGDYFSTWGGYLFIVNGLDANLKWNGDYASRVGVHERPAAPRAKSISPNPDERPLHPDFSINDEFVGVRKGS